MKIKGFPRVHITLIDLAGVTKRRYGGAGFSLDTSPVEMEVNLSTTNELQIQKKFDKRDEKDVWILLEKLTNTLNTKFSINIISIPLQHVGFGSKTALLLAIGTACNALLGNPISLDEIKKLSGRGGASGVGVNVFYSGGFVVDLGHPKSSEIKFVPSSARQIFNPPPAPISLPFPQKWNIHLFIPNGRRCAGTDEFTFFQNNTPIPGEEALNTLAAVYHGIIPAIIQGDLHLLKEALIDIHATGFKQRELIGQNLEVKHLLEYLNKHQNISAGMSSMGPLIYAITQDDDRIFIEDYFLKFKRTSNILYLGSCKARNSGYEISGN